MNPRLLPLLVTTLSALACPIHAQTPPGSSARAVHRVAITPGESRDSIVTKAANLVPSPAQLAYHRLEFTCFAHFGLNTFTGNEWGSGKEDPAVFNPGETLDTDQWARTAAAAGMKLMLFTVKHHDGFCLWQTRYNDAFSVRAVPWRSGKGDVVRELAASCRKHGLKFGVYLSPADLYQMESATGLYGNGSKPRASVIPTDPRSLVSDPSRKRAASTHDAPEFRYEVDDYNRYFLNQLYELLTEYGPIHEVWFDGAHPKQKGGQQYHKKAWFEMIRALAPEAVIFGGPDVRWCGNEAGHTREEEWSVLPVESDELSGLDRVGNGIGSIESLCRGSYQVYGKEHRANYLHYLVSEVDTSIRAGWFWRNEHEQSVRSADDILDIYERAVGGNCVFLLNVPPDRNGRFAPRDVAALGEAGRRIRATYGTRDLNQGARSSAPALLDGKDSTWWMPDAETGTVEITLPETRGFNRVVLQEPIGEVGQRVAHHAIDVRVDGSWREVATGRTIGYKRILRFPTVNGDALRVRILESRLAPAISEISIHRYDPPPPALDITRGTDGMVRIEPAAGTFGWKAHGQNNPSLAGSLEIRYTTDGSEPGPRSTLYHEPIALPDGGKVRARATVAGKAGPPSDAWIGVSTKDWKLVKVSSEHDATYGALKAFDGNPSTFWHTDWSRSPDHPHELIIDLGRSTDVAGIAYLPRQDKRVPDGMIERGTLAWSRDGKTWTQPETFRFGNLLNDPARRIHTLANPQPGMRFLRLTSTAGTGGKPYAGAAEIEVLGKAR